MNSESYKKYKYLPIVQVKYQPTYLSCKYTIIVVGSYRLLSTISNG